MNSKWPVVNFTNIFTSSFSANIFFPKKLQSQTVTREKQITLSWNKAACKTLMKLTPEPHVIWPLCQYEQGIWIVPSKRQSRNPFFYFKRQNKNLFRYLFAFEIWDQFNKIQINCKMSNLSQLYLLLNYYIIYEYLLE